jgi:cell division initiation protein
MLTINDVEKYRFGSAMFGYSRADVDEFVSLVVDTLQHQVEQIELLKKQLADVQSELERYRASEGTLRDSIVLAQKSRDEIVANAQKEAENILAEARVKAVEMNAKHAEIQAARERFEYEFYGLLKGFIEALERKNPQLAGGASAETPEPPEPPGAGASGEQESGPEESAGDDVIFPEEKPR